MDAPTAQTNYTTPLTSTTQHKSLCKGTTCTSPGNAGSSQVCPSQVETPCLPSTTLTTLQAFGHASPPPPTAPTPPAPTPCMRWLGPVKEIDLDVCTGVSFDTKAGTAPPPKLTPCVSDLNCEPPPLLAGTPGWTSALLPRPCKQPRVCNH
jgi:hypothetical protein